MSWLIVTAATPVAAYVAVRHALPEAFRSVFEYVRPPLDPDGELRLPPMNPDLAHLLGFVTAYLATITVAKRLWHRWVTTAAPADASTGGRRTASMLGKLPSGFVAFHDLRVAGSRSAIDHLVIGPTGVFTIDTEHWTSPVRLEGSESRAGHRSLQPTAAHARHRAEAASAALGVPVAPIVVVHGAPVRTAGWFTKPYVDGVRFCSGPGLRHALTKPKRVLRSDEIDQLVERAAATPALEPAGL